MVQSCNALGQRVQKKSRPLALTLVCSESLFPFEEPKPAPAQLLCTLQTVEGDSEGKVAVTSNINRPGSEDSHKSETCPDPDRAHLESTENNVNERERDTKQRPSQLRRE